MAPGNLKIKAGGQEYPAYMTMGALRRYKRATGTEMATADVSDVDNAVTFLYCLTAAACSAERVPFDFTVETFADSLLPADMADFFTRFAAANAPADAEAPKKAKPRRG